MSNLLSNEYIKSMIIISYGLMMVLLSQYIISFKNPAVMITKSTIFGLGCLLLISMIGILISKVSKSKFPILGWVSLSSLFMCLGFWPWSEFFITSISSVNFLSLTTPVLAFAGVSVANSLGDISKITHKIIVVGLFVFLGTFLMSAIIAQVLLTITGKI